MKELKTEILIDATPEKVWQVLLDQAHYPHWNPFVREIKGHIQEGKKISVRLQPPGQKEMTFQPLVLKKEENREFRWRGKLFFKGLFDGEHYFILEALGPEKTRLIHGEQFRGLLVSLVMQQIGESTRKGFEAMNKALKKEAELQG
ncbi:MAG: SRPBCC domain-containing protein [Bacteroidota bacterium]